MSSRLLRPVALWLLLGLLSGCRASGSPTPQGSQAVSTSAPEPGAPRTIAVTHEILDDLALCEARYRGLVVDLSSPASEYARPFRLGPFQDIKYEIRAGERIAAIHGPNVEFDVWLDRPAQSLEIAARLEGGSARTVSLAVDGVSAGTRNLTRGEVGVLRFPVAQLQLERGRHTLTLRFSGKARGEEPFARASWLRMYVAGDADVRYAAPTNHTLLSDVAVGGEARRSISLRAPGSVRCGLMPTRGVRLHLDAGYRGTGSADVEVRAQLADGKSVTLWGGRLEGSEDLKLTNIDVSLDPFVGQLIALEFAADASTGSGRVVFAEPRLARQDPAVTSVSARNVVVIVAGGLDRSALPPWAERQGLNNIYALAEQGVLFDGYRASSSVSTSVMASLLTGLPASAHGVLSISSRIPTKIPLISRMLRERASDSAFFTNVPTTQAAFGFGRDWGRFESHSPLEDLPATQPVLAGADWLKKSAAREGAPRLLVAHASGGHPPWDVTIDELGAIPPKDYEGPIDPRRGALTLREYRTRAAAGRKTLSAGDWTRISALQAFSLRKLDAGLGTLFRYLEDEDQWDNSLVILMGDVGIGDRPEIPFAPDGALTEGRLAVPLIVKFPRAAWRGLHVNARAGTGSIARTITEALGLNPGAAHQPPSLTALAELGDPLESNPVVSRTLNNYAFYLGRFVLRGTLGQPPSLFDLEVDPAAQTDLSGEQPFLVEWMWRLCVREMKRGAGPTPDSYESVELDADTRAAMSAYGI